MLTGSGYLKKNDPPWNDSLFLLRTVLLLLSPCLLHLFPCCIFKIYSAIRLYSRKCVINSVFRLVKACPHCRRKVRLSLLSRRFLRQSPFSATVWKAFRLSTVANRSFPVVAARIWNDLPADLTSAESLSTFRQQLKTQSVSEVISGYFVFCLDL